MTDNRESFLDAKTFMAIGFLLLSWLGWSHYMKKKYPPRPPSAPVLEKTLEEQTPSQEPNKKLLLQPFAQQTVEKKLEFKGENMDIVFSSKGFGVEKLILKGYFNREAEPVQFYHPETPLFSNALLGEAGRLIPFVIKKEGKKFVGLFSSPELWIKKSIEPDDEKFILKVHTEVKPAGRTIKGLSLFFSHAFPKKEDRGFFNLFFIYGQDILKAFVFHKDGQSERLEELELEEGKSLSQVDIAALGGKYFGKAFINQSAFLPSVLLKKEGGEAQVRVDYEFLNPKKQELKYQIFLGPKSFKNFQKLGGGIQQWIDFGFFGWLARPLLLFLNWLYSWSGNWGLAIILLTIFVRLGLLPINIKSYKSMKIMQKIQPQIKELKSTHKADPKKMNLEVMALMKKHKANPLGGCLPLFIQFPVFFALYRVLGESIELYQSPFAFWIKDLSLKDPYYALPILAGLVLFVQQKITPMNLPKEQVRLLTAMPLVFSVFMLGLPSGLTLYIFVSGLFGLAQQFFFVKLGSDYFKGGSDVKTV